MTPGGLPPLELERRPALAARGAASGEGDHSLWSECWFVHVEKGTEMATDPQDRTGAPAEPSEQRGEAPRCRHLVITVHGIRTFGDWQTRLQGLLAPRTEVEVSN